MPITTRSTLNVALFVVMLQIGCLSASAAELAGEISETKGRPETTQSSADASATSGLVSKARVEDATVKPIDAFQQGKEFMKSCRYDKALEAFNIAARENPASAEPHFARARALLGLGRREEAYKEFKLCMLLDPSGRMRHKCKSEIDFAGLAAPLDFSNQPRTITTQDLEKATTNITNQAENEIKRVQDEAVSRGAAIRKMDASVASSNPYSPSGWYVPGRPSRSGGGYISLSGTGGRTSSNWAGYPRYESNAMRRATELAADARARSEAIREAASGLNESMSTRPSEYSGVYLSPHGTNLFVRNYVNFEPVRPEPPEALSAKALSLDDYRKFSSNQKPGCSYVPNSRGSRRYK